MKKREHLGRYIALAGIFLLVCLIYIGRLVNLQIAGQDYYTMTSGSKTSTRTVTIQALRGQIYDRNGVALVTNKYSYDVSFEATTLPAKNADKNPLIMSVIARVRDFGAEYDTPEGPFTLERNGEKFVFSWNTSYLYKDDGSYTVYASRLMRLLDDLGAKFPKNPQTQTENEEENTPDRDIPLPEADDCAALLLKRYGLTYTEKKKTYYTYNAEETRELFCFRLDMELRNFAPLNPYLIAEDAPLELITLLSEGSSRGISVKTNVERVYGVPGYASHILGRVGKIQPDKTEYYDSLGYSLDAIVGVSGVEKAFEDQLRGIDGQLTVIEASEGNVIDEYVSKEPIAGNDVYLTIDIEYQKIVEDSLDANIAYIRALAEDKEGELDGEDAKKLLANGVKIVAEVSNMGCRPEAIDAFIAAKIPYGPGKAVNAGGVATSGLEMTQNSQKLNWTAEEVDAKLHQIMSSIHHACVEYGTEKDGYLNYMKGANIAGFMKVAKSMVEQGIL